MKISNDTLVSLDVAMYDAQGNLLEKSESPLVYLHGHDDIFPRIEEALVGKEAGAHISLQLEPEDAFGNYDTDLVMLTPVQNLGGQIAVGLRVEAVGPAGEDPCLFTITDVAQGMAVLDANHPLAGIALRFDIRVIDVRPVTDEDFEDSERVRLPDFLTIADIPKTRQ